MENGVFDGVNKNTCVLYVPSGSKSAYQVADQWKDFINIVDGVVVSPIIVSVAPLKFSSSSFSVSANKTWTASSNQTWLGLSRNSGLADTTTIVVVTAITANSGNSPRTATVTVSASGLPNQTVTVTQKAASVITWNKPADIYYGTSLSNAQLNATTPVPGIFVYNPANGTSLNVGQKQKLTLVFTPTDTANYGIVYDTVLINVNFVQLICIVRYDVSEKRNMIVWEREIGNNTKAYKILRQTTTTVYDTLGTVPCSTTIHLFYRQYHRSRCSVHEIQDLYR